MKTNFVVVLLIVFTSLSAMAQTSEAKWRFITSLSYGSENNVGNPGFMLTNEVGYRFHKNLEVSARLGFFNSMPWFHFDQDYLAFSCLTPGVFITHTARFSENKNFVRVSAGACYFRTNSVILYDFDPRFSRYNRADNNSIDRFGLGLSIEGGGRLSQKIDLTFLLQIYSYEIFGDIIVLGPNLHIKL